MAAAEATSAVAMAPAEVTRDRVNEVTRNLARTVLNVAKDKELPALSVDAKSQAVAVNNPMAAKTFKLIDAPTKIYEGCFSHVLHKTCEKMVLPIPRSGDKSKPESDADKKNYLTLTVSAPFVEVQNVVVIVSVTGVGNTMTIMDLYCTYEGNVRSPTVSNEAS